MKRVSLFILLGVLSLHSCQKTEKQTLTQKAEALILPTPPPEKYVYLDKGMCLHVNRLCTEMWLHSDVAIANGDYDETGTAVLGFKYSVHRMSFDSLKVSDLYYCCSGCVDDAKYDSLLTIAEINAGLAPKKKKRIPGFSPDI